MAYDLVYLRNRVLDDKLDDDSIDPAIIDRFLNDTQRYIYNNYELPFMEKIYEGTLPIGNYMFAFPTDLSLLQAIVLSGPTGEQRSLTDYYQGFREFNRAYPTPLNNEPGTPLVWTTYGGKLLLSNPTDAEYTLSIFYLQEPVDMVDDTDVPSLPRAWEEVLLMGAYWRALERNEDFDLAAPVKQEFTDGVLALIRRSTKRQSGAPIVMGQPRNRTPRRRV